MTDNITDDMNECSIIKDFMANQCLLLETENNYICNPNAIDKTAVH